MSANIDERLLRKVGRDPGFRVPDGYFGEMAQRVMDSLPERQVRLPKPPSRWQRLKPYLYMAAMFAGIWCMMKVFHTMSTADEVSLDNMPTAIAQVMQDYTSSYETFDDRTSVDDIELLNDVADQYSDIDEFIADFGYSLDTDPASANLSEHSL